MADAVYPKFKEALMNGSIDLINDDIRAILVDTDTYTYNTTHEFLTSVGAGNRVAVSGAMTGKSVTSGTFIAADLTWSAVTGDISEAVIIYKHTGVDATANLICYMDSLTGLPVTPNGGDINLDLDAAGIFTL
jgi:hypothetical protein